MRLEQIKINNFRSCRETEVQLGKGLTVLVGENASGKSAIIDALRLTTIPAKQDRPVAFSVENDRNFDAATDEPTSIQLKYSDLSDGQKAAFITQLVDPDESLRYSFQFQTEEDTPYWKRMSYTIGEAKVEDAEPATRNRIAHVYLPPLRDAVREIDGGGGERIAEVMQVLVGDDKDQKTKFLDESNELLDQVAQFSLPLKTKASIANHLKQIIPPGRPHDLELGGRRHTLRRLASILRLRLTEAGISPVDMGSAGLGYANLVYIASIVVQLSNALEYDLTLLLVEEPEAHLHPQLQTVLLHYLNEQIKKSNELAEQNKGSLAPAGQIQVIVTTHSPHLVSSISVRDVAVVARQITKGEAEKTGSLQKQWSTKVTSLGSLGLKDPQIRKIDRYLSATRAALLFARDVVLVEGISEAILLPVLARKVLQRSWQTEPDAEERIATGMRHLASVTYVAIDGVDFAPYLSLLLEGDAARVDRVAVVTDGDITKNQESLGQARKARIENNFSAHVAAGVLKVFCGYTTLEADIFAAGESEPLFRQAHAELHPRSTPKWDDFIAELNENSNDRAKAFAEAIRPKSKKLDLAKGDFAQIIAEALESPGGAEIGVPEYLEQAIAFILQDFMPEHLTEFNKDGTPSRKVDEANIGS